LVPFQRNPYFTGRDKLLDEIYVEFEESRIVNAQRHPITLFGGLGVGKTQVATEYCWRYKAKYKWVFWIEAADQFRLLSGFEAIAGLVHCEIGQTGPSPEKSARAVREWLRTNRDWLLVIDNFESNAGMKKYMPALESLGDTLIITNNEKNEGFEGECIEVMTLSPQESVLLLLSHAKFNNGGPEVEAEAMRIVDSLACLPLAIEQAAAVIRFTGNIFAYYETYRTNLLSRQQSEVYDSMPPTWNVSFQYLSCTTISLLECLAFLDPDDVQVDFLKAGRHAVGGDLEIIIEDDLTLREHLERLHKFSLIRIWEDGRRISIHRLLQVAVKSNLEATARHSFVSKVIRMGACCFPEGNEKVSRTICNANCTQVKACLMHSQSFDLDMNIESDDYVDWNNLVARVATYLLDDGYILDAQQLRSLQLNVHETILGQRHPHTLSSMTVLAEICGKVGQFEDGIRLAEEALSIRKAVFGLDQIETLWNMSILATLYHDAGRVHSEAEQCEALLEAERDILGPHNFNTLKTMSQLGWAYHVIGRNADSADLLEQAGHLWGKYCGPEGLQAQMTYRNIAAAYIELGQWEKASEICKESAAILKANLGPDHPETIVAAEIQAAANFCSGKAEEAAELLEETLERYQRLLGPQHPQTLTTITNLSLAYIDIGRTAEAIHRLEETLKVQRKLLGDEDLHTLWSMHGVALAYERCGEYSKALEAFEETFSIRKRILGLGHVDTLRTMYGLASAYMGLSNYNIAIKLLEEVLEMRRQVLQPNHPDITRTATSLMQARERQGQTHPVVVGTQSC
jgi:tetratricopeptide (TPR) repeat protein